MKKRFDRKIVLPDGSVYKGYAFGSRKERFAEIVFNTSMVGYQEILSDRSYTDQAVVMTYPLIGNYGICEGDYESDSPMLSGMIVRDYCDAPSNFRCSTDLESVMESFDIAGVYGVDTRALTRHIRDMGSSPVLIADAADDDEILLERVRNRIPDTDQVKRASTPEAYEYTQSGNKEIAGHHNRRPVVVIDCGIKKNILRMMSVYEMPIIVTPWDTDAQTIMGFDPAGVFISNGPGNPEDCSPTIETVRYLKGRVPVFGICLGHQIISLAYGAKTYKLKFGHRGGNHPVKNLATGKIEITSQNHSYAVIPESLEGTGLRVTHINLLDDTIEGIECPKDRLFSLQYHPESAPGPRDSTYVFDRFFNMLMQGER